MSETNKQDHWLSLASEIGAEIPRERLIEQHQASEEIEPEPLQEEESTGEIDQEPTQEAEPIEEVVDGTPDQPEPKSEPVPKSPAPKSPAPERPKSAAPIHWYELATELGLDVPEPEEPEPEEPVVEQPLTQEVVADEPVMLKSSDEAAERQEKDEGSSPSELPETTEASSHCWPEATRSQRADSARPKPEDARHAAASSLFEHPDLRLDAPGVLDAVFDGDEEAVFRAIGGRTASREVESSSVAEELEGDVSSEFAREVEEFAEEGREAEAGREPEEETGDAGEEDRDDEDAGADAVEADDLEASGETEDDEPRGRRRKRRRRRRPSRRERGEAGEGLAEGVTEEAEDAEPEDSFADEDDEVAATCAPGPEPEQRDTDDEQTTKAKHKKIPTWDEAVGFIVSANVENRSKTSSYGSRGRGGRRGRR